MEAAKFVRLLGAKFCVYLSICRGSFPIQVGGSLSDRWQPCKLHYLCVEHTPDCQAIYLISF